jgi:hypothetical protein
MLLPPSTLFPNKKRETGAHPVSLEKLFIFHPNQFSQLDGEGFSFFLLYYQNFTSALARRVFYF